MRPLVLMVVVVGCVFRCGFCQDSERKSTTVESQVFQRVYSLNDFTGDASSQAVFDSITQLIQNTVEPDSWLAKGGRGIMLPYPSNFSIVVTQRESAHQKIASLLTNLRKVIGSPVSEAVSHVVLQLDSDGNLVTPVTMAAAVQDIYSDANRLRTLEKRVKQLEAQVRQLNSPRVASFSTPLVPAYRPASPAKPIPSMAPSPHHAPPVDSQSVPPSKNGWRPFFFNGEWFYMVPLSEADKASDH